MGGIQIDVHKYLASFEAPYGAQESSTGLEGLTQKMLCCLLREQPETEQDAARIAMAIEFPVKCHLLHIPQINLVHLFFLQHIQVKFSSISVENFHRIKQGFLQARKKYTELHLKGIRWESSLGKYFTDRLETKVQFYFQQQKGRCKKM